jgi:hypothetical protein
MIYRRTKNLRAVQLLLGHTKLESTVRYRRKFDSEFGALGIELAEQLQAAAAPRNTTPVALYGPSQAHLQDFEMRGTSAFFRAVAEAAVLWVGGAVTGERPLARRAT